MDFRKHDSLKDKHAFLSASKYHWINYDIQKLESSYLKFLATQKGTELHEFASRCIELKQKLPKSKKTLNAYVNDAIGFRMTPEQTLYYSENCFGTADAIAFRNNTLRIHDLKTGVNKAYIHQLMVYAALFCLEYEKDPREIDIELRIYQYDEILIDNPNPEDILVIMDKIRVFDKKLDELKEKEGVS